MAQKAPPCPFSSLDFFSRLAASVRAFCGALPESSCMRMTPSSCVSPVWSSPSEIIDSSRLPPPRSPTTPAKSGIPEIAPSAAKCASSSPLSTLTLAPIVASTASTKDFEFEASRTAEVAST